MPDRARQPVTANSRNTIAANTGRQCPSVIGFVHINKAGGSSMLKSLRACCREKMIQNLADGDEHGQELSVRAPSIRKLKQAGERSRTGSSPSRRRRKSTDVVGHGGPGGLSGRGGSAGGGRGADAGGRKKLNFFHASAYRQQDYFGDAAWDEAFTFALVRNPWARQVSMFTFLLTTGQCGERADTDPVVAKRCQNERMLPKAGSWITDETQRERAVREFRGWLVRLNEKYPPGHPLEYMVGSMAHGNDKDPWFNASQVSWLVDGKGKLLVDEVIKLEELSQKWLQGALCDDSLLMSQVNPSIHGHYSDYYDDNTQRILVSYMQRDIERFNYTFERQPK